ncbi:hypothetical protein [Desulfobacter curvatus]|uniref:hypothetical protein n=1 Tax=Desulfobacter curvatus TaxID=2290 RepID=UPI0012FB4A6D|nr:hypothetical protein [Desulfobacter curvatus]
MKQHIAFAAAAVFTTSLFTGFVQAGPGRHGSGRGHHHRHPQHNNDNVLKGVVLPGDCADTGD